MGEASRKAALITGASSGLGKALAARLAEREEYAHVYVVGRNAAKLRQAQTNVETQTGRTVFENLVADLEDAAAARTLAGQVRAPVDTLVLNAGGT